MTTGASHLRLYDKTAKTLITILPDLIDCSAQEELNAVGQLTATYPRNGYGADYLFSTLTGYLGLWEDGFDTGLRFRYDGDSDDPADPALQERSIAISCPGAADALKDGIVYPQGGLNTAPWHDFKTVTPGAVLVTLLSRANIRGTLLQVSASFTSTADSAGLPWPNTVWLRYDEGKTVLDVVTDLAGRGLLDFRVRANPAGGLFLDAYAPSTFLARDHSGLWRQATSTTSGSAYYSAAQPQLTAAYIDTITGARAANVATNAQRNINVPLDGSYTFWLTKGSGDVARLLVDGSAVTSGVAVTLTSGLHEFILDHATGASAGSILLEWAGPGFTRTPFVTYKSAKVTRGRDVTAAPRQRSRSDLKTVVLVSGDKMTNAERTNPAGVAQYDRREAYQGESGVFDFGTLALLGDATLARLAHPQTKYTAEWIRGQGDPEPGTDFGIGEYIRCDWIRDSNNLFVPMRARSIVRSFNAADDTRTVSVELNDPLIEHDVALARAVHASTLGSVTGGNAGPVAPVTADLVGPVAPSAVTIVSATYVDTDGSIKVGATISWPQVTDNTDGTAFDDLGAYNVIYKLAGSTYGPAQTTQAPVAYISALTPGATMTAGVQAADASGNKSAYTYSAPTLLVKDTTPPNQPSVPTVTPVLGGLRLTWDGKDFAGAAMPSDFYALEVHASTVAGFTPTDATLKDLIVGPAGSGASTLTGLSDTVDWYVRIVAVDGLGNKDRLHASTPVGPLRPINVAAGLGPGSITAAALSNVGIGGDNLIVDSAYVNPAHPQVTTVSPYAAVSYTPSGLGAGNWIKIKRLTVSGATGDGYAFHDGIPAAGIAGKRVMLSWDWKQDVAGQALTDFPALQGSSATLAYIPVTLNVGLPTAPGTVSTRAAGYIDVPADATGTWHIVMRGVEPANDTTNAVWYTRWLLQVGGVATAYAPKASEIDPNTIVGSMIQASTIVAAHTAIAAINPASGNLSIGSVSTIQLTAYAVTAEKLTIGSLADNVIRNGSMEETSSTTPTLPAGWATLSTATGTAVLDTASPLSGTQSLRLTMGTTGDTRALVYPTPGATVIGIPTTPGDVWFVSFKARATSTTDNLRVLGFNQAITASAGPVDFIGLTTAAQTYTTTLTIPAGMNDLILTLAMTSGAAGDSVWIDDVVMRKVLLSAAIGDGQITTPKLVTGAVVADKIAANAITAGKMVIGGDENAAEDPDFEDRPAYAYGSTPATGPFTTWDNMANSSVGTGTTVGGPFTIWHAGDGNGLSPEYGSAIATHPGGAAASSNNGRRVSVKPGDQFYASCRVYNSDINADARIRISWRGPTDAEVSVTDAPFKSGIGWSLSEVYAYAPYNAVAARVALVTYGSTRGAWKGVFFRRRTDASLIVDGAVLARMVDATNITAMAATINSAVIQDAMIATLSVAKLTAGSLFADMTVSARIKTANSGARTELNGTGLQAFAGGSAYPRADVTSGGFYHYNASGVEDFGADSSGVRVTGTLRTGSSGQRAVLSPTGDGTYWTGPAVVLYTGGGELIPGIVYSSYDGPASGSTVLRSPVWANGTTKVAQLQMSSADDINGTGPQVYLTAIGNGVAGSNAGGLLNVLSPQISFYSSGSYATRTDGQFLYNGYDVMRVSQSNKRFVQGGSFDVTLSAAAAATGTFTYSSVGQPNFTVAPVVILTCKGAGDCIATLTNTPSTTGFGWRIATGAGNAISATITVHFMAFGG